MARLKDDERRLIKAAAGYKGPSLINLAKRLRIGENRARYLIRKHSLQGNYQSVKAGPVVVATSKEPELTEEPDAELQGQQRP